MNRSKIEWCDFSLNPIKGLCPVDCKDNQGKSYCYARRMYQRFHWNSEIRFEVDVFDELFFLTHQRNHKPSRIFVGSTMELFGEWIKPEWLETIFRYCHIYSDHTFIFLTKQPQNLIKWSPFPTNCWVGVSLPMQQDQYWHDVTVNRFEVLECLRNIKASVKFISFEPLLSQLCVGYYPIWWAEQFKKAGINWLIIGQQTPVRKSTMPKILWIDEVEDACKKADIPYFEKFNLKSLLNRDLIQEFPK